jgi:hypothetical protein
MTCGFKRRRSVHGGAANLGLPGMRGWLRSSRDSMLSKIVSTPPPEVTGVVPTNSNAAARLGRDAKASYRWLERSVSSSMDAHGYRGPDGMLDEDRGGRKRA